MDALLLWVQGGWKQAGVPGEAIPRLPSEGTEDASAVQVSEAGAGAYTT